MPLFNKHVFTPTVVLGLGVTKENKVVPIPRKYSSHFLKVHTIEYDFEKVFVRRWRRGQLWELRGGLPAKERMQKARICLAPANTGGLQALHHFSVFLMELFLQIWELRLIELK